MNALRSAALLIMLVLAAAACGTDDAATTAATETASESVSNVDPNAEAVSHTELTPGELEVYQADLNAVGCWAGEVDGQFGPHTETAVRAFQEARGLTVDGLLGPTTEAAIEEAFEAGETVCTHPVTTVEAEAPRHHSAIPSDEIEEIQQLLNTVGCFAGAVDGELGPHTQAAIRAYQAAAGLTPDGLYGPMTAETLAESAAEGGTICTSAVDSSQPVPDPPDDGGGAMDGAGQDTAGSGSVTGGGSVTVTASNYNKTFPVGSCSSGGESDIQLAGSADNITLVLNSSSISIDGGTEQDGITLSGTVSSVSVGDAGNFTVTGTFTDGNAFTATGTC